MFPLAASHFREIPQIKINSLKNKQKYWFLIHNICHLCLDGHMRNYQGCIIRLLTLNALQCTGNVIVLE